MRRTPKVLLGFCLLAVVVFGSIKVFEHHEDGGSDYEKIMDERSQEQAEGKDTFPLTTLASRKRYVALYCLYMAGSMEQLRRCYRRPARDVYRSTDNEAAGLFASEVTDYCEPGAAGRFCDPFDIDHPVGRIEKLIER